MILRHVLPLVSTLLALARRPGAALRSRLARPGGTDDGPAAAGDILERALPRMERVLVVWALATAVAVAVLLSR